MNKLIAVFGSLRKGFHNHYILGNSELVGEFNSAPEFKMLSACGGFPYLVKDANGRSIKMEVYRVTDPQTSNRVDRLEGFISKGNPHNFYDKDEIQTPFGTAEFYFNHDASGPEVISGDWAKKD